MGFTRTFQTLVLFALVANLVANYSSVNLEKNDIDSHLDHFASINVTHHDNIDDEPHAHKHKHSEDGEEHEHSHEHAKVTQSELKLLNNFAISLGVTSVNDSKKSFFEKSLVSNPHPSEIYRPPISA